MAQIARIVLVVVLVPFVLTIACESGGGEADGATDTQGPTPPGDGGPTGEPPALAEPGEIWVADRGSGSVSVIDAATDKVTATVSEDRPPRKGAGAQGGKLSGGAGEEGAAAGASRPPVSQTLFGRRARMPALPGRHGRWAASCRNGRLLAVC